MSIPSVLSRMSRKTGKVNSRDVLKADTIQQIAKGREGTLRYNTKQAEKTKRHAAKQARKASSKAAVEKRRATSATAKTVSRSSATAAASTSTSVSQAEQARYNADMAKYNALITGNVDGVNAVDESKPGSKPQTSTGSTNDPVNRYADWR